MSGPVAEVSRPVQSAIPNPSFIRLKTARVDDRGRFYLPEMVVAQLFKGVPSHQRRVNVYIGPRKMVLIQPVIHCDSLTT